jgi:hypothetical protein
MAVVGMAAVGMVVATVAVGMVVGMAAVGMVVATVAVGMVVGTAATVAVGTVAVGGPEFAARRPGRDDSSSMAA